MPEPGVPDRPSGRPLVVGLIGGIGAGKSAVAARWAQHGAEVMDADRAGHQVLTDAEVIDQLTREFGASILADSTAIDRKALAQVVFAAADNLKRLERVVHPRMRRMFEQWIAAPRDKRPAFLVLDAAVLLEAGWDDLCDLVVYVNADTATRRKRVAQSRGWSDQELARREQAQWPLERKRARADWIVENPGTDPGETDWSEIDHCFERLAQRAGQQLG